MIALAVFGPIALLCIAGMLLVVRDGVREGEYRRPMYRKPRQPRRPRLRRLANAWAGWNALHRPQLPRRAVRDLGPEDARTAAWVEAIKVRELRPVTGVRAAWLRLTAASMVWQAITHHLAPAAIPPTETPQLDYSDTSADWAGIREQLFAMLAEDGAS